jgi:RNA polymerase sigma factor (TIGR02999 family)
MVDNQDLTFQLNPSEITLLFQQANTGEEHALNKLVDILYYELKHIATSRRHDFQDNNTINTTALVNETWLKLKGSDIKYANKRHFLSIAAISMRQILLDAAKSKHRIKRPQFVSVAKNEINNINSIEDEAEWLYQLDLILKKLEKHSPRGASVFNLKFFCGLTLEEVADCLEISSKTAQRDWEKSKQIISTTFKILNS